MDTPFHLFQRKKNVSCEYSSRTESQNVLGRFINLIRVRLFVCLDTGANLLRNQGLSFTLERAASNEYPLHTFYLRNKKIALWVSTGPNLVLNRLYCKN